MFYNSLEDIEDAIRSLNPASLSAFDASCFDGRYVTPEVTEHFLGVLEARRGAGRTGAVAQQDTIPAASRTAGNVEGGVGCVRSPSCGNLARLGIEAEGSVCETLFNEA